MIQSILFDKKKGWTIKKAARWISKHNYRLYKIDDTDNFIRIRQIYPYEGYEYRTKKLGDSGIEFILMYDK